MPIPSSLVGQRGKPQRAAVDARWTMAYAAALDDGLPQYLDTTRADGIVAHPLFSVCLDWPVLLGISALPGADAITRAESARGVHATHAVRNHRLVRPDEALSTVATVVGVERRRAGAYLLTRLDSVDDGERPVCTTWYGSMYRGVEVEGPDRPATDRPEPPAGPGPEAPAARAFEIALAGGAAHVYTECARIWNPIHTDLAVARAAGLPGLILHGTATLAHAVSTIVREEAGGEPARVREVHGRFSAMVRLPSTIRLELLGRGTQAGSEPVHFRVRNADGDLAIRDGCVVLAAGPAAS